MDAVFLAAAVPARPGEHARDLGCGAGAAILALGTRVPAMGLAGLEIQPAYAALARENAARNGLGLEVLDGDVAQPPPTLRERAFDHVLMNPPYYDRASTTPAWDPGRDLAHGGTVPLGLWLDLAARRLRPKGVLTLIQRSARLPEVLAALPATMGSVAVRPLAPREGRPAATILLRSQKGGRTPFRLLAPLAVHAAPRHQRDEEDLSPWAVAVLRDGAELPWD